MVAIKMLKCCIARPGVYAVFSGDSVEPKIPHGSIVIVDPAIHADSGRVVVVRQNDDTEAITKRLVIEGGVHLPQTGEPSLSDCGNET